MSDIDPVDGIRAYLQFRHSSSTVPQSSGEETLPASAGEAIPPEGDRRRNPDRRKNRENANRGLYDTRQKVDRRKAARNIDQEV